MVQKYIQAYFKEIMRISAKKDEPRKHGIGSIVKEVLVSKNAGSFLSKDVFLSPNSTIV